MKDIRNVLANGEPDRLIEGLSLNDYLALPAISGSSIIKARKSLLAVKYHYERQSATTDPMRVGSATDHLLFEHAVPAFRQGHHLGDIEESFIEQWPVIEETRRGKAWVPKSERMEGSCPIHLEHGVQYINGQEELDGICEMVSAVCLDPVARTHWGAGMPQVTMLVTINGIRVKMRPDWICEAIDDLKTSYDLTERSFASTAWRLRYPDKMALYRYGYRVLTGHDMPCNLIAVQSKDEPDVIVQPIDVVTLSLCEEWLLDTCKAIYSAILSNNWPGVANGKALDPLAVPPWEMSEPEFADVSDG